MASVSEQLAHHSRQPLALLGKILRAIANQMPKGLYARALIIIIAPIVLLESIMAFVFMERHWETVTRRLSIATTRDVAMVIATYENFKGADKNKTLITLARDNLDLSLQILPPGNLPPARPKPFFSLLDRTLSDEIRTRINRPFWIDTVGRSRHVEIRVKLDDAILRVLARRSQTYASNSHIFLLWLLGTALVLLTVAVLFLRNQIKPILRLSIAAEKFGKGQPIPEDFRPRGAREVRQASRAFLQMRDRIERHVDQRTTMLAGVSHDLRTILTRLKLQLAMHEGDEEAEAMRADVNEMQHMLEDYMAFAKGDGGEETVPTALDELFEELCKDLEHLGKSISFDIRGKKIVVPLRRNALKRALSNLINNAARYAENIEINAKANRKWLWIEVDDDGPGIPFEKREDVFRPFHRLDDARTQSEGNSGLGLSITRDVVQSHGGDIHLEDSPLGGLKAVIKIPH